MWVDQGLVKAFKGEKQVFSKVRWKGICCYIICHGRAPDNRDFNLEINSSEDK